MRSDYSRVPLDMLYPFRVEIKNPDNKVTFQNGYHQSIQCQCEYTTAKGSYRDVYIRTADGKMLYYYHQHCIGVLYPDNIIQLDSCGYVTKTTRERLTWILELITSSEWVLQSIRGKWYIVHWRYNEGEKTRIPFYDGIVLKKIISSRNVLLQEALD